MTEQFTITNAHLRGADIVAVVTGPDGVAWTVEWPIPLPLDLPRLRLTLIRQYQHLRQLEAQRLEIRQVSGVVSFVDNQ